MLKFINDILLNNKSIQDFSLQSNKKEISLIYRKKNFLLHKSNFLFIFNFLRIKNI